MTKSALCIGINDYPGTDADLRGCVNDAHDWASELARRGFAVDLLLNDEATRQAMRDHIARLIEGARSGDTVVLTYSGHGTWAPDESGDEPDGRDEGLCPHDIASTGPLLDDDLRILLSRRAPGVRVVLVSDSCHSGSVSRGADGDQDGMARVRFLPPGAWLKTNHLPAEAAQPRRLTGSLSRAGGDLLLAGCQDTEYSWDTSFRGRPNGAFTYHALKALDDPRAATYQGWFQVIRESLPSSRAPQSPQIMGTPQARQFRVFS